MIWKSHLHLSPKISDNRIQSHPVLSKNNVWRHFLNTVNNQDSDDSDQDGETENTPLNRQNNTFW